MSHRCLERPTSKTCSAVPAASARGLEGLGPITRDVRQAFCCQLQHPAAGL